MPIPPTADEIVGLITAHIERGDPGFRPGDRLPSWRLLADRYDVSVPTISRVMRKLREAGLVIGVPGRASYVADDPRP